MYILFDKIKFIGTGTTSLPSYEDARFLNQSYPITQWTAKGRIVLYAILLALVCCKIVHYLCYTYSMDLGLNTCL